MKILNVISPVYDPSGVAHEYFVRLKRSIFNQVNVDIRWHVSVQEFSSDYDPDFDELQTHPKVKLYDRRHTTRLSEHLTMILERVPFGAVHLLCQDDFYCVPNGAEIILKALQRFPVIHIKPVRLDVSPSYSPAKSDAGFLGTVDKRRRNEVLVGINKLGGLSTFAWRSDLLPAPGPITFDLMADCQLRFALWRTSQRSPLEVSGVMSEGQWAGQSQHSMKHLRISEAANWVRCFPQRRIRSVDFATTAAIRRNRYLAAAWLKNAFAPVRPPKY